MQVAEMRAQALKEISSLKAGNVTFLLLKEKNSIHVYVWTYRQTNNNFKIDSCKFASNQCSVCDRGYGAAQSERRCQGGRHVQIAVLKIEISRNTQKNTQTKNKINLIFFVSIE